MSMLILEDDELTDLQVELFTADLADALAGTLWPDDLTTPWPACPAAPGPPLMPAVVWGRATWRCERDHEVEIPIGELAADM